ncbi:MAG: hypothetical protein E4H08_06495 [Candidatus Atribacteria bacterium]|nr:MAG: hypothetical protein E4H08_06495 [Candidatus Atribacteria bacterium]
MKRTYSLLIAISMFLSYSAAADTTVQKLLELDEWVISAAETVIIEGVSCVTPTDFVVQEGGTLIIRDSQLRMTAAHHHDNYFQVAGNLLIENSEISAVDPGAVPFIASNSSGAEIEIHDSTLELFTVQLFSGYVVLQDTELGGVDCWFTQEAQQGKAEILIQRCALSEAWELRYEFPGEQVVIEGLGQDMREFEWRRGRASIAIYNSTMVLPSVSNIGTSMGASSDTTLHILNSVLGEVSSWEGGHLLIEGSIICGMNLRNTTYHEYRNLHPGAFADKLLVDHPDRQIRLIDSQILSCWDDAARANYATGGSSFGICVLGISANVSVIDSEICELRVGRNVYALDSRIGVLQIYASSGTLQMDGCHVDSVDIVKWADTDLYGSVTFEGSESSIRTWGGWTHMNLTRHIPVIVVDAQGSAVPNASVLLRSPAGLMIGEYRTGQSGRTEVSIPFSEDTYLDNWELEVPAISASVVVRMLSDTPIQVTPSMGQTRSLEWGQTTLLSNRSESTPADPNRDIVALLAATGGGYLYVRVEFRGNELDVHGLESRYEITLSSTEWDSETYTFVLDKGELEKESNWEQVATYSIPYKVDGGLEIAVPLDLIPEFGSLLIQAQSRDFPDRVDDYIESSFP